MLAGQISSTGKKQEFVIQSNSSSSQIISLYYKGSITVDWGDGNTDYLYSNNNTTARTFSHTYSTIYSGQIKIRGSINVIRRITLGSYGNIGTTQSQIQKLSSLDLFSSQNSAIHNWNFDINHLPSNLTFFQNTGTNQSYGTINDLPSGLTYFNVTGSNLISGDIFHFFGTTASPKLPNLTNLTIDGNNTLYGDLISVTRGNFSTIDPWPLTNFSIQGNNQITGEIDYLQFLPFLDNFYLYGNNTVSGDISYLPGLLTDVGIQGNNQITGDIANLPSNLDYMFFSGRNTTYGDIASLPSSLAYYYNAGSNSVTGDIQYLSTTMSTFYSLGRNTIYGNISTLKPNLSIFTISGLNTVTGNISIFSSLTNLNILNISGRNTIYGDIQYLPTSLESFSFNGSIISGTLSSLNTPTLKTFILSSTNSISGNISDIPVSVNYLDIRKNSNKLSYTGKVWPENMVRINLQPQIGKGLTTAEVDQMIIDLSNVGIWDSTSSVGRYVWLAGHNEPRSSASDAAKAILISKSVAVTNN
jgi:hypothetical protein